MKYIVILLVSVFMLSGCQNKRSDSYGNATPESELSYTQERTGSRQELDIDSLGYYGVYNGTFPSASGEGIKTTLTLYDDNRYVIHSVYINQDEQTFEEQGTYLILGDLLTLKPDDNGDHQYYRTGDGHVTKLDNDKKEITGQHALNYRLIKKK